MAEEIKNPENLLGEALTDDELDKFLDSFSYEMDMDAELEKIERGELSMTQQENSNAVNDNTTIISSEDLNTDIILTQYIDKGFNKGRINYG